MCLYNLAIHSNLSILLTIQFISLYLSFSPSLSFQHLYYHKGGLLAHSTGMIYAFPAHANEVLCVDTNVNRPCITGNTHSNDNFHKEEQKERDDANHQSWRVHTIPIRRHPEDTDSPGLQYKWLGGAYGADGCIYGMPRYV